MTDWEGVTMVQYEAMTPRVTGWRRTSHLFAGAKTAVTYTLADRAGASHPYAGN